MLWMKTEYLSPQPPQPPDSGGAYIKTSLEIKKNSLLEFLGSKMETLLLAIVIILQIFLIFIVLQRSPQLVTEGVFGEGKMKFSKKTVVQESLKNENLWDDPPPATEEMKLTIAEFKSKYDRSEPVGWRFCSLKTVPNLQRDEFDCGDDEINRYLKDLVETADETGFSRTFLMISETGDLGATERAGLPLPDQ
ncbi:hypothetical protein IQ235_14585 [Oscillatoriales cyanobacterium LEGE 11467]|uniref:Uncharacterized protein n=1 Tax=Zarconia navalis LEGE 11467 TaxID=1828826 RepID=A0A928VXN1_9CYAN|nr:hypothetical protein [Zarconia navalis]MBE9042006.1 hypothetical protein [Zarconia navalis LEGE 11467]